MNTLPPPDRLYKALIERDPTFEGVFVVGVKTTGVFCRPSCSARKPRRENCEFFSSAKDALYAGYRPCLRCRPLDAGRAPPPVVERLLDLVEADPGRRLMEHDLRALGIDPSTARRQFLKYAGMTFHAYQRARRMGLALHDLRHTSGNLPHAMHAAGYQSFSGFTAAFAGIFGKPPSDARSVRSLLAHQIMTPLGPMIAIAGDDGLVLLEFHDRRALEREIAWLRRRFRAVVVPGRNEHLSLVEQELAEYFDGTRTTFRTPFVLEGSPFQVAVWKELLRIPPGQTRSYAQIAAALGRHGAHRAVGRANGDNRLAIVVPCHRVIKSDGSMCGYGGGIWRKQKLLELEGRAAPAAPIPLRPSPPLEAGTSPILASIA